MTLTGILEAGPVRSVEDATRMMNQIDALLPDGDGVKWFNRLYLRVTENVGLALAGATFRDPAFLTKLDVVFANLYFSALAAGETRVDSAPAAWQPLLRARHRSGIARIQFALAGMNAHINRDLPEGIVQSFIALGGDPMTDDRRQSDFDSVNAILESVEAKVKTEFAVGPLATLDRLGGDVDDAVAMWNVKAARSAAWTNAQVLWGLRPLPPLRERFFTRLDGLVGLTGQGLLQPRAAMLGLPSDSARS